MFQLQLVKKELFLCNERKITVKPTMHQNSAVSKAFFKITDHKYRF